MTNYQSNTKNTYYAILSIDEIAKSAAEKFTDISYSVTLYNRKSKF